MSEILLYRQYWMATIKGRQNCQICGDLAINALAFVDENGTCESVVWFCDQDLPMHPKMGASMSLVRS